MEIANRKSQIANPLRLALLAALALAVATVFLSRFVLVELNLRRLGPPLALAIAQALAILGVGRMAQVALARLVGGDQQTPRIRIDFVLGYPLFGAICFLMGLISTRPWMMGTILVLGVVSGGAALRQYGRGEPATVELSFKTWAALAILLGVLGSGLLSAQLPAATLDEVAYHLAVPRIWVSEGRVVDLALLSHSYFPFGVESADLPLLALLGADGAMASHFVHLLAALATALLIHAWLRRRIGEAFALIGVAAIVTTPALMVTAGWSWNEWPLLGISVALLSELDQERPNRAAVAGLIAAGLMTKYSFPVLAVVLLLTRREKTLMKPALIGLLAGSLFLIRNVVLTGNPVAPFGGSLAPDVAAYRSSLAGYIFDGAFLDESLGIALIALAIGAILVLPADRFLRWSATGLLVAVIAVGLGRPSARLLLPFLAPLAMIAMVGIHEREASPRIRGVVAWSLIAVAALQLFLGLVYLTRMQPFDLLVGRASDRQYVEQQRRPAAIAFWIDSQLPAGSRALILGIHELFWFSRPVRGGGNFDSNRISAFLQGDLRARLSREGFTHIAIAGDGMRVGSSPQSKKEQERLTMLDPAAAINLREFLQRHAALVAAQQNTAVYRLK